MLVEGRRPRLPLSLSLRLHRRPRRRHLYSGAADTSVALATGSIRAILQWLDQHGRPS
jgi:hypothetical protein